MPLITRPKTETTNSAEAEMPNFNFPVNAPREHTTNPPGCINTLKGNDVKDGINYWVQKR